jgi:hypothetical protein
LRTKVVIGSVQGGLTGIFGWYWTGGSPTDSWSGLNGARLQRGGELAQTNWRYPGQRPAPIYREWNYITADYEQLRDCTGIPRWEASIRARCIPLTSATYRNVRK